MNVWLRHSGAALVAVAVAPAAALGLAVSPLWRKGLGERLGLRAPPVRGAVWVHGASVGEILTATRLLDALIETGRPVVASTTKATGRSVLAQTRPAVPRLVAPLDHPWCVSLALDRLRPAALVLIETELWPSWIAAAARRGIPVAVVSARLSDRSFARYRRIAPFARGTFSRLAAVGARSAEDANRFLAMGVPASRVEVTGDLKLAPPLRPPALAPDLAKLLGEAVWWVAASTHTGEDQAALDALATAEAAGVATGLVLAPRHLERVSEVARAVSQRGRRLRRRSELGTTGSAGPLAPGEVLLLDTLGELPAILRGARLAFVGGSLAPVGGHNVLEPALAGRPVIFGPHTHDVRDAAALLLASGGARRVSDAVELAAAVVEWLKDPAAAEAAGEAAQRALEPHRGATERALRLVESLLVGPSGNPR